MIEIGVSIGIISMGGLLVMIGLDKLNLGKKSKQRVSIKNGNITAKIGQAILDYQ
jgi:molybdopterin-containing oxidoreductase family membrane subunit